MRRIVQKIDRALKALYRLNVPLCAEDFLICRALPIRMAGSSTQDGALYLRSTGSELELGIYLSPSIREELDHLKLSRNISKWTLAQFHAFAVTAEEVSHFLYVIHHASAERSMSQLELEIQGEIDKFLMIYFQSKSVDSGRFSALLEMLFVRFRLASDLGSEEKERYLLANRLAKKFVQNHCPNLAKPRSREKTLRLLRRFYRLDIAEKMSLLGPH